MFFHMYIGPGRGRQPLGDKLVMSTERPCHFAYLVQVSKTFFELIFNAFPHV